MLAKRSEGYTIQVIHSYVDDAYAVKRGLLAAER